MRLLGRLFFCFLMVFGSDAVAQDSSVLVINTERLFAESKFGQDIRRDLDEQRLALQAENERIVEQLVAEEQDLAARRPDMPVDEFRAEADAFDQKAIGIRAARDAKDREISAAGVEAQNQFNDQVREIVGQVMLERGGEVVLDSRTVYIALRSADITDDVIGRLDALRDTMQQNE